MYGALAHFGISKQNSFGIATTNFKYYPIISEGLAVKIEQIIDEAIRGRFAEGPSYEGIETTEGDISMNAHPLGLGHFLRGVFGVASSTLVTTGVYEHEFLPADSDFDTNCALPPYTCEVYRGVGQSWQFTDVIFPRIEFSFANNQLLKATVGVMARTSSLMTKNTPVFEAEGAWAWSVASIQLDGQAFDKFTELSITFDNQIEATHVLNMTKRAGRFRRTGFQQVRITGSMLFESQSEYMEFRNQSERRLLITLDDAITSYNILTIDIPKMRYTDYPVAVEGPGYIVVGFSADGKYDTNSKYAIRITLTNTVAGY